MLHLQHRTGHRTAPGGSRIHEVSHAAKAAALGRIYNLIVAELPEDPQAASQAGGQAPRALLMLRRHLSLLEFVSARQNAGEMERYSALQLEADARRLAQVAGLSEQTVAQILVTNMLRPRLMLRPLVVRATLGEQLELQITNLLPKTLLSLKLVDDDYGIQVDGPVAPLAKGEMHTYHWRCSHVGIYPIFNQAATVASERRCLLGVLIIEP